MELNQKFVDALFKNQIVAFVMAPAGTSKFTSMNILKDPSVQNVSKIAEQNMNIAFLSGIDEGLLMESVAKNKLGDFRFGQKMRNICADEIINGRIYLVIDVDVKDCVPGYDASFVNLKGVEKKEEVLNLLKVKFKKLAAFKKYIFATVFSGNGIHIYFRFKSPLRKEFYRQEYDCFSNYFIKEALGEGVRFDSHCSSFSRLIRLPGSMNLKNNENPVKTEILFLDENNFADELMSIVKQKKMGKTSEVRNSPFPITRRRISHDVSEKFVEWAESIIPEEGMRNTLCCRIIREGLSLGVDENLMTEVLQSYVLRQDGRDSHPYTINEAVSSLKSLKRRHEVEPFQPIVLRFNQDGSRRGPDIDYYTSLGRLYLEDSELYPPLLLRYQKESFYLHSDNFYKIISDDDQKVLITKYFQSQRNLLPVTNSNISNVLNNLKPLGHMITENAPPFFVSGKQNRMFAFKNGLIDLDQFLLNGDIDLSPPDPDYFNLGATDYDYVHGTTCPIFLNLISQTFPDDTLAELVQEIFGYLLVVEPNLQKFFILLGRGANGKSVLLTVLTCLLGKRQISNVPLEFFDLSKHRFALAQTYGKLANIVSELNGNESIAIGLIKSFVGRDMLQVERKNKPLFEMIPTARLLIAANEVPPLRDRTDGLWRRMIVIPFTQQVLDEKEQDKRLIDHNFWLNSGELSGILDWSLVGLRRLLQRGHFLEPEKSIQAKNSLRTHNNPAYDFIIDFFEESMGQVLLPSLAYGRFREFCEDSGIKEIIPKSAFTSEIKRIFPRVVQDRNPTGIKRERLLRGIQFKRTHKAQES